jgi:hypothetical protein
MNKCIITIAALAAGLLVQTEGFTQVPASDRLSTAASTRWQSCLAGRCVCLARNRHFSDRVRCGQFRKGSSTDLQIARDLQHEQRLTGKVVGPLTIELVLKTAIFIGMTPIRESQLPR